MISLKCSIESSPNNFFQLVIMEEYYLFDIKNKIIKAYPKNNILDLLYFMECRVPTPNDIKYIKLDNKIKKFFSDKHNFTVLKQNISKI